ncbi:MAG: hypothetical protein H6797_05125 [Candidatus Nomurabacteria bacterium]|nr:MAG: hypothetical protein H6797_05125 [Candidatus Nomurabacteria bacterium]
MKPELPAPQAMPEYQPQQHENAGHFPDIEGIREQAHEKEQAVQPAERQSAPSPAAVPLPPSVVSLPSIPTRSMQDDNSGPTIASDDDLIEKEWVDRAKGIIAETQNDPYRREQEVNKLQIDYLRKRYGKELGTSN